MSKLSFKWHALVHICKRPFQKTYTANVCGHETKQKGFIPDGDDKALMEMPLSDNGNPDHCIECIGKMSIRCAWCGNPIHIGNPVTLYMSKKGSEIPKHAVRYQDNPECLVGCLRWECANSGADRQGFWVPPGVVERVLSPIEMMFQNSSAGDAVIVHDLSDRNNLGTVVKLGDVKKPS